jgi:hypothetical protein
VGTTSAHSSGRFGEHSFFIHLPQQFLQLLTLDGVHSPEQSSQGHSTWFSNYQTQSFVNIRL